MEATVLYGARDVRFEDRPEPAIIEPTDAVIRLPFTCICGSDLWPYRGIQPVSSPMAMGHEYCGFVEEVGRGVTSVKPAQFAVRNYLPKLIDLVFNGTINPGKVFDLVLPLEQVAEGYRAMDERRAIKTLLQA
jgi:threonine dehydrogenase-like Zn-dependent dehydrogenase